jgi:hypothetical protein
MTVYPPAPSPSLTTERVHPQLQQFLESYVRVYDREPPAEEIAAFEVRHGLTNSRGFSTLFSRATAGATRGRKSLPPTLSALE